MQVFGCILTTLLIELDLQDKRQLSCHSSFSNEEICEPLCNKKRKSSSLDNLGGCSNPFGVNTQLRTKVYVLFNKFILKICIVEYSLLLGK